MGATHVTVTIRNPALPNKSWAGKNPIEMTLNFCGIPPFGGPMPPKNHTIKAPAILDLYSKVTRWFRKYGYILI
ncbi:MAG: hypothetical protein HF982_14990 [Desulfobacteraceae bacterium]|nr:hypothetical protein [Desulfobacteraceae bacterium]MBC2720861.1 hypothetical protein [Desulfobacteraceae bacterium]